MLDDTPASRDAAGGDALVSAAPAPAPARHESAPRPRPAPGSAPARSARRVLLGAALLVALASFADPARGDGWIEIHPPLPPREAPIRLEVIRHEVGIEIDRGLASVSVAETFRNPHGRELEGTYYFPVPPGAQVEDFRAVLGDRELAGEILPAEEARRVYEELVRRAVDPAILEYYRRDLFRARVFPIPAHGEVSLSIAYRHRVPSNGGLARLRYPLDTGRFTAGPYRDVRIDVSVKTDGALHSVLSPSHPLEVVDRGDRHAKLRYRAAALDARHDLLVDIIEGSGDLAGGLRAFRESDEDGWFVLRLAPGRVESAGLPPVTLVLAVDVSGSMAGVKLDQAKEALRSALGRLRPQDRLQVLGFSSRVTSLAETPLPANRDTLERARSFIDALLARGGTDIDGAIERAVATAQGEARESTVLLITDGAPTVGVTDPAEIARRARERNGGDLRIHVLGVGAEVNTRLLDRIARENRGSRTYLEETGELEVALGALLDRVLYPAMTDLRLAVEALPGARGGAITVDRVEPPGPWDLFHGDDLVIAGRFRGDGPARLTVEGIRGGERRAWTLPAEFPRHGGEEEAAYLWAELRIVRLLEELRDRPRGAGGALEREVVELSLRYGIVTPYTSYLIRESPRGILSRRVGRAIEAAPGARERSERAAEGFGADRGAEALEYSRRAAEARRDAAATGGAAGQWAAPDEESVEREVGLAKGGGKALVRLEDDTIVDGELGGLDELPAAQRVLVHLSEPYFEYLRENPGVERILARGSSLLFRWRGEIVRVAPPELDPVPAPVPVGREYF